MAASLKTSGSRRGHRRGPSEDRRQAAVLSPSVGGPLGDDSLPTSSSLIPESPLSSRGPSPIRHAQRSRTPGVDEVRQNIVALICRPEIYRPLPPNMIPPAFLSSPKAAKADASVADLVRNGQFHAAAITSARQLSSQSQNASLDTIFELFYTRLACLSIINSTCLEIAAVEALELRDLTAAMFLHPVTNEHVVPWSLRVLAVRLQSIGFKDWRRGIMSCYVLAHDARQGLLKARRGSDTDQEAMWSARLHDLGIRVANMLVEMGDLDAAARHLNTLDGNGLPKSEQTRLTTMQTLLWLQIGDMRAVRACLAGLLDPTENIMSPTLETMDFDESKDYPGRILHALAIMAEGSFAVAANEWAVLRNERPGDDMIVQNLAVCLLYTGRMVEANKLLDSAVDESTTVPYHTLLFNLCTFYELATDRAKELKTNLTRKTADVAPSASGWQRATADFKMEQIRA